MTNHRKGKIESARRASAFRRSAPLALIAMLLFASPLTGAADLAQAQQACRERVDAHNAAVNANAENRALNSLDSFMDQTAKKVVPTSKQSGASGASQNFSCHSITQDAFNDVLQEVGGLFGDYSGLFSSIFGGSTSASAASLCDEAQKATGGLFNKVSVNCPKIAVPGMPISCKGTVGLGTGGITYSGSGKVGGASGSTSGTVPYYPAKASPSGVGKFSCWLSNSCGN